MSKRTFVVRDGKVVELGERIIPESDAAFVRDDTFKKALRHPKTGEMVDSVTKWNRINRRHGLRVVGNDWKDSKPTRPKDKITDSMIMDAIHKAEAIMSDPDKRNAKAAENRMRYERFMERKGQRIPVERII